MSLQITYSGQEKGMATIDMQDPRRIGPRERICRIIQMNMDSPLKLCAAFKRAFGGLLALDNKEYLEVTPGLCHPICLPLQDPVPLFMPRRHFLLHVDSIYFHVYSVCRYPLDICLVVEA